jgi:DNA primase
MTKKDLVIEGLTEGDGIRRYYSSCLSLKATGTPNQFMACCPFHEDKHPSLSINVEKGLFHCFGCDESGDIFTFRMRLEHVSFPECLAAFAEELGISK